MTLASEFIAEVLAQEGVATVGLKYDKLEREHKSWGTRHSNKGPGQTHEVHSFRCRMRLTEGKGCSCDISKSALRPKKTLAKLLLSDTIPRGWGGAVRQEDGTITKGKATITINRKAVEWHARQ